MKIIRLLPAKVSYLLTVALISLTAMAADNNIHPEVQLLDQNSVPVVTSKQPMSATETCTDCHDGDFITKNHDHPPHIAANCLLCHSDNYNAETYISGLQSEYSAWAPLAGMTDQKLAVYSDDSWQWQVEVLGDKGELTAAELGIKSADSKACGQCHGIVYNSPEPLVIDPAANIGRLTRKEGVIYSGQKISRSGMDIAGKDDLNRSFDVHAERLLQCTDCHRAANNPLHGGGHGEKLSHLIHDPRQPDISVFLEKPDHNLVIGVAGGDGSCKGCHAPEENHGWLDEVEEHMAALACESCHITELYGPAQQLFDHSVRDANSQPVQIWRGMTSGSNLNSGFRPVLLKRPRDGKFAPYNVTLTRFWRDAATNDTVATKLVDQAWRDAGLEPASAGTYPGDAEIARLTEQLKLAGISQPEIATIIEATPVNHGVSRDSYALSDCDACHAEQGRMQAGLPLAPVHPGYISPASLNAGNSPAMIIKQHSNNQLFVTSSVTEDYELNGNLPLQLGGLFGGLFGALFGWQWYKRSKG